MKRYWMDTETYDGSAYRAHPVKDSDGDWVKYSEAQAEIARLQAEVERYEEQNRALLDDQITCACGYDDPDDVCGKHHPAFKRKLATARADALEEAAQECESLHHSALQGRFPQWNEACVESAKAIRALIDKDQPSTFKVKSYGAKQRECATEGCTEDAIDHIIMGGVGSDYCLECADKVVAARNKDQPK